MSVTSLAAPLVGCIGWALIHFVWQGAVIGGVTAFTLHLMRHSRPEQRYIAACIGLFMCLVIPVRATWCGLSAINIDASEQLFTDGALQTLPAFQNGLVGFAETHLRWIVAGWALCVTVLSLRICVGLTWIGNMRRLGCNDAVWQVRVTQLATRFGITRAVRMLVVADLSSPITAGWWRPVVFVPAALLTGMPADMLEALLVHEMAHIKRHDYLINLLQNAVEILLFFHPAVWWISRQMRVEREHMADDFAARKLGEPRRLALALSELERIQFSTHHLAQAANGGDLMVRIKRLVESDKKTASWKASIPAFGLAVACMALYAQAATPDAKDSSTANVIEPKIADLATCRPKYPAESEQKGETGTVLAKFTIDAKGKLVNSEVVQSSGHKALDDATIEGIKQCGFIAATKNGQPIKATLDVQYVWKI